MHAVQGIDHGDNMTVDLTEATLGQDGQIIITGEDGQGKRLTNESISLYSHILHIQPID